MPPRKKLRTTASGSTSSSHKGNKATNNDITKHGIKQFFAPLVSSSTTQSSSDSCYATSQTSRKNPAKESEVILVEKDVMQGNVVTPPSSKPYCRFSQTDSFDELSLSPGMLIKSSQDEVFCDEGTRISSPVNQKLHLLRSCSLVFSPTEKTLNKNLDSSSLLPHCVPAATSTLLAAHNSPSKTLSNSYNRLATIQETDASELLSLQYLKKDLVELLDQTGDADLDKDSEFSDSISTSFLTHDAKKFPGADEQISEATDSSDSLSDQLKIPTFLVLEVFEKNDPGNPSIEELSYKVLRLLNEPNGEERIVHLLNEWFYTNIFPGDIVHVIGEFDDNGICVVNRDKNLIIIHPDILISGTRVAGSFGCSRRSVLDERLKCNEHSTVALVGTLLHQIFQAALTLENPSITYLEGFANYLLKKNIESIYACGVTDKEVMKSVTDGIPRILAWISHYKCASDSVKPIVDFGSKFGSKKLEIVEVIDIEDMARSSKYGLKGIIDASVKVNLFTNENEVTDIILPLEIKTGKSPLSQSSIEHSAQVILYTLLMSERYREKIDFGLLCYLQSNYTKGISVSRSDVVALIMRRNELALEILKASTLQKLPSMLQNPNMCKNCRHLNICTIYHKEEGGTAKSCKLGDTYDSLVGHLTDLHLSFLRNWERSIDLEFRESTFERNKILSQSRPREASSISAVLDISAGYPYHTSAEDKYIYRFMRQNPQPLLAADDNSRHTASLCDLNQTFKTGDYVILSTESGHQNVAQGVVRGINQSHIDVTFSKRLRLPENCSLSDATGSEVWRIEKDEVTTSFSVMRYNIVSLFLPNPHISHLRKMIVDLEVPRFDSVCTISQDPAISYVTSLKFLNDDQRKSIIKILSAKDYALILGMPGTGKTSTLVHAVRALLIRGASVLLTSYTNSALDNLLIKLKAEGIDFLRIGRLEVIHESIRDRCFSSMNLNSVDDLKSRLEKVKVVGVTCLGISSPLLVNKTFDVCIMDEAGQISLPISLGPLMAASMFVLVGDHYQLPPLVQSAVAKENGMGVSLFCKLSEAHPEAISALRIQYRMCRAIMELSNSLIYGNRLCCGSPEIANAKLIYTKSDHSSMWLDKVLHPSRHVIFLNTDGLDACELKESKNFKNPTEAYLISKIATELVKCGIDYDDIGIVAPYNSQANLIRSQLHAIPIEIHTIDKYQGRDKDCILVSFVRSRESPTSFVSSILGDWQRINVAITRAKKKLVMIGSPRTLSKIPLLKILIHKVEELSGIINLSKNDVASEMIR